MNDTTLDPASARVLTKYLMDHEDDIALQMNDFGDLTGLFKHVFGRSPERTRVSYPGWIGV